MTPPTGGACLPQLMQAPWHWLRREVVTEQNARHQAAALDELQILQKGEIPRRDRLRGHLNVFGDHAHCPQHIQIVPRVAIDA